jgi:hypothetical protein
MTQSLTTFEVGAVIRLRPELLHRMAMSELAGSDTVTLLGHGGESMPWALVERPGGKRATVLNGDIEDALVP